MKSLGKQLVTQETFINGVSDRLLKWEQRVVYHRAKDDTYHINFMDSKHQIEKRPDGSFYWAFHIRSVKVMSFDDVLAELKSRLGA